MNNLAGGMYSGIGSPSSKCLDRSVGIQLADRGLELGLDAVAIALTLPTTKRRTLVLQAECDPLNKRRLRRRRRGFGAQTSDLT